MAVQAGSDLAEDCALGEWAEVAEWFQGRTL
jgi:hypothetical protein